MKALILAAGYGKRLLPITEKIPKSMVEINGVPLLVNTMDNLADSGIEEIGIVVGHMADCIRSAIGTSWRGIPVTYYENSRYLETNNVVSLYQALDFCHGEMLLLECDIYCRKDLIEILRNSEGDCAILTSPFDPVTMDGTIIRTGKDGVQELILGKWQRPGEDYTDAKKTVNMYRFSASFAERYMQLSRWYVENMGETSYYEKVLGSMMYLRECDIRVVEVPASAWCEIDDADDIRRAEHWFD